jgi:hypothetical protein
MRKPSTMMYSKLRHLRAPQLGVEVFGAPVWVRERRSRVNAVTSSSTLKPGRKHELANAVFEELVGQLARLR